MPSPLIDPSLKAKIEAWRLTDPRNNFLDDELCLKWMAKEEKEELERNLPKKEKRPRKKRTPSTDFKTWKTIKLGTHQNANALRTALLNQGDKIGDWANDILNKVRVSQTRKQLELVKVTVAELGFPNGATTEQIYQKAKKLGLELCPVEVGPQLRLQYQDQPLNEWIYIGMKQITDQDGDPLVFGLCRVGDGLWLYGWSGPANQWYPESQFVFRKVASPREAGLLVT